MPRIDPIWMSFAGTKCSDIGVKLRHIPDKPQPEERGEFVNVLGRDGALWRSDGAYANSDIKVDLRLLPTANLQNVRSWLIGSGNLVFSDDPSHCYRARIHKSFNYSKLAATGMRDFTVPFVVYPLMYETNPQTYPTLTTPGNFPNPGTANAQPIITLTGSGDITLLIGSYSVLLENVNESITLNCESMMAYKGDSNQSSKVTIVSDDWPVLIPGTNMINWTGNVTGVTIVPQWRWR